MGKDSSGEGFNAYKEIRCQRSRNRDLKDKYDTAINTLKRIHSIGNTRSGKTTESKIAYDTLVKLEEPL